ncbi:hypothetical protein Moror_7809 [Moniliophthora roreri MCA 2997]|uniref:BRCT domain-containing protein n=2 Tax=Moniliophthora roreri TaxID=221103 RepID=V2YEM2_MONRO|nr:hypothetical protein Moror_7809 [Moniliophthora roreri MCA 2997]
MIFTQKKGKILFRSSQSQVFLTQYLACFSPEVPRRYRVAWVKNGGALTHSVQDFKEAEYFFCVGMQDEWLKPLRDRDLTVRHPNWITYCIKEDFLMPCANYILDEYFEESEDREHHSITQTACYNSETTLCEPDVSYVTIREDIPAQALSMPTSRTIHDTNTLPYSPKRQLDQDTVIPCQRDSSPPPRYYQRTKHADRNTLDTSGNRIKTNKAFEHQIGRKRDFDVPGKHGHVPYEEYNKQSKPSAPEVFQKFIKTSDPDAFKDESLLIGQGLLLSFTIRGTARPTP